MGLLGPQPSSPDPRIISRMLAALWPPLSTHLGSTSRSTSRLLRGESPATCPGRPLLPPLPPLRDRSRTRRRRRGRRRRRRLSSMRRRRMTLQLLRRLLHHPMTRRTGQLSSLYPTLTENSPVNIPSAPVASHPDPKIQVALQAMMNMGFSNEGGWLSSLLEAKNGDIGKVLDILQP